MSRSGCSAVLKTGLARAGRLSKSTPATWRSSTSRRSCRSNGIREKVIFYGIEDIATNNPLWRVFAIIKKLTPNFVQFNKLPASKLQGVVTRVEM